MSVATVSISYIFMTTISLVGMGDIVTKDAFEWLLTDPKILKASNIIFRLMDDIVSYKVRTYRTYITFNLEFSNSTKCYITANN